jgi:hypothetical protein
MTPRSKPKQRQAGPPDPAPSERPAEQRPGAAEGSSAVAETAREDAERARVFAEEGRELAEEIRRGAESLRGQQTGSGPASEHGRRILEAAFRAESRFQERFDVLVEGINEMTLELKRLREDAAVLRKVLSDMQRAASEEQIIAAERQATQRRMDRERPRDRR